MRSGAWRKRLGVSMEGGSEEAEEWMAIVKKGMREWLAAGGRMGRWVQAECEAAHEGNLVEAKHSVHGRSASTRCGGNMGRRS